MGSLRAVCKYHRGMLVWNSLGVRWGTLGFLGYLGTLLMYFGGTLVTKKF